LLRKQKLCAQVPDAVEAPRMNSVNEMTHFDGQTYREQAFHQKNMPDNIEINDTVKL